MRELKAHLDEHPEDASTILYVAEQEFRRELAKKKRRREVNKKKNASIPTSNDK